MTRVTNVDHILLLLQAQLERMERQKRMAEATKPRTARGGAQDSLAHVRALAGADGHADSDIERALVAALLTQEFGAETASDAGFQVIVERVAKAIAADDEGASLLRRAALSLAKS
jgi:hypothetical protein